METTDMKGLTKLKLTKTWNAHDKGSTIAVDALRAKWLVDNGYTGTNDDDDGADERAEKRRLKKLLPEREAEPEESLPAESSS